MQQTFLSTIFQMIVFFLIMFIGFFANKKNILPKNTDSVLSKILSNIIMPALSFKVFSQNLRIDTVREKLPFIVWSVTILTLVIIMALFLSKLFSKDKYVQKIYLYSLVIANLGYMGYPVTQAVFGEKALFNMMVFSIPFNVYIYSVGIAMLNPNNSKISLKSLINPVFSGMIAGAVVGLLNIPLPKAFITAVTSVSDCMSVIAMLLTGFVISKYDIRTLFGDIKIYLVTALRLLIIPICGGLVFKALSMPNEIMVAAIVTLAMPLGLNTVVFPAAYGGDTRTGASMALVSNLFAVITIPLIFAYFL